MPNNWQASVERRRHSRTQSLASLKLKAVTEQRKILAEARESFAAQVKVAREKTEKMLTDERQKIERLSGDLKEEFVSKLLGVSTSNTSAVGKEI